MVSMCIVNGIKTTKKKKQTKKKTKQKKTQKTVTTLLTKFIEGKEGDKLNSLLK
jgi:hypothetical protein